MHGNGEKVMTKRKRSSELSRARKETKRLQREANTRIRKAVKRAKANGDDIALRNIEQLRKSHSNVLSSNKKSGLPKSFRKNVMREKGRSSQLKRLNQKSALSKKKQKRQTTKTFEKLYGKEKTKAIQGAIGGGKMNKLSSEFWDQLYKAQDMLFSMGIVPADEIMGKFGSIGSGLLEAGKQVTKDGYWAKTVIALGNIQSSKSSFSRKLTAKTTTKKVTTNDLAKAIVAHYKLQYGLK